MKPTDTPTRRTILGAGLGALAAFVAHAVGRPAAAEADNGDIIRVGDGHSATNLTSLYNIANSNEVFQAETRTGVAIRGISRDGHALEGRSGSDVGVYGFSETGTGMVGHSDSPEGVGIMGETSARTAFGVAGTNLHTGTQGQLGTERNGVVGIAPIGAGFVGVRAYALEPATALQVDGRASFSRSGTVMVPAGRSYADVVVPDGLTAATFLVATPMVNRPGVHVQSAVPNLATGKVRIYLNRVASPSASTPIGWFAIN